MKKIILLVSLVLSIQICNATPISFDKAAQVAYLFLQHKNPSLFTNQNWTSHTTIGQQAAPEMYLFQKHNSFVIVSGDDVVTPILGYSLSNTFDEKLASPETNYWINQYAQSIRFARSIGKQPSLETTALWEAVLSTGSLSTGGITPLTSVAPIMTTTWNQKPRYNKFCPTSGSTKTPAGCVATAMAQIMNYWGEPTTGTGNHSYSSSTVGGTLSADFGATTYDWANMPNALTSSSSTTQIDAIATLMYHCGIAVNMNYDVSGSGAQVINYGYSTLPSAQNGLVNYFNYKNTIKGYMREDFYDSTWLNMLKFELDNDRLILYAGFGSLGGHAFIFDGYDDADYFHVNWGWGGMSDGYFVVDGMNPPALGTGGGGGGFNTNQQALVMIEPSGSTLPPNPYTPDYAGLPLDLKLTTIPSQSNDTVNYNSPYTYEATLINEGTTTLSGKFLVFVAQDTNDVSSGLVTIHNQSLSTLTPAATYNYSYSTSNFNALSAGKTYAVYLLSDNSDGFFLPVQGTFAGEPYLYLTVLNSPTAIQDDELKNAIHIFPNPAADLLTINNINASLKIAQVSISDINGRTLITQKLSANSSKINIQALASGTYFINIATDNGHFTGKFVKQ